MPLRIEVVNQPPETSSDVSEPLLDLFQDLFQKYTGDEYLPFKHQAKAFHQAGEEGKAVFLVAGTASGKTLAIAIPLFWKLKEGHIKKVLLMYPTVALLEDQRKVMDKLAEITGLEVGQLQGGMSRSKLIAALNKPVILATPDEIYWFFRKNVKYNSLLIYGLALVDEFVLDEAHLFNGLMLRNLSHLKQRIQLLGEKLGKHPRWHVLTATPTPELQSLMTDGVTVQGKSKCGDVEVTFLEPANDYNERSDKLVGAVESALADGANKVLLVFNSADLAHRVFEGIRGRSDPDLPLDIKLRFGRIRWVYLKAWLENEGIDSETVGEIEQWLRREEPLHLKDLVDGVQTKVPTEMLAARVARLLESQTWVIRRLAYSAEREKDRDLIEGVESRLGGRTKIARLIWGAIRPTIKDATDYDGLAGNLDAWVGDVQAALERIWAEDSLVVTSPALDEVASSLREAGMSPDLASRVTDYLRYSVELPEEAAAGLGMSPYELARRRVAFSWFEWLVKDESRRKNLMERVLNALAEDQLEVETRHIAVWEETDVPVVIYTGKMSKTERKGLIEVFDELPRAVLVSTPAVEVGVDFAADTLITEQCDGNGFLQRFGRVGRRPDVRSRVVALIKEGETYVMLHNRCGANSVMTREEFSSLISAPDGLFPARLYAEGSDFLDATHWLVNAQLGEIGGWLNQEMFEDGGTSELAKKLLAAGLSFAYGLRGTMPGVALQGGAGGGESFYILRKIYNDRLMPSSSPFEMARADMWYMEFLWRRSQWNIVVDAKATLESSQALFWWQDGRWHLRAGYGIAADYVRLFQPSIERNLRGLEAALKVDPAGVLAKLRPHASKPRVRPILRVGEALPLFFLPHARFVLGQGDVYLLRQDMEGIVEPVEDRMGNPLVLHDQIWLILLRYGRDEAESLLSAVSALDIEELVYDWQTLDMQGSIGPMILDRITGACFDVYRRLVEHAGR